MRESELAEAGRRSHPRLLDPDAAGGRQLLLLLLQEMHTAKIEDGERPIFTSLRVSGLIDTPRVWL